MFHVGSMPRFHAAVVGHRVDGRYRRWTNAITTEDGSHPGCRVCIRGPASTILHDARTRVARSVLQPTVVARGVKSSVALSIPVPDAIERVLDRAGGLRVVRSGSGAEFHTASGLWVGTLRPDDDGSRLLYRTGPTTPTLRHAVKQGERLRGLLQD